MSHSWNRISCYIAIDHAGLPLQTHQWILAQTLPEHKPSSSYLTLPVTQGAFLTFLVPSLPRQPWFPQLNSYA